MAARANGPHRVNDAIVRARGVAMCVPMGVASAAHVVSKECVQRLQIGDAQVGECASTLLGHLHSAARDVVGLAERHAFAHQVFGEVLRTARESRR
jgi:hypothetical protein